MLIDIEKTGERCMLLSIEFADGRRISFNITDAETVQPVFPEHAPLVLQPQITMSDGETVRHLLRS